MSTITLDTHTVTVDIETANEDTGVNTRYLVLTEGHEPTAVGLHGLIDRMVQHPDSTVVYLLLPGGGVALAEVYDVSDGSGIEWEVCFAGGSKALIEYVLYSDESRAHFDDHNCFIVGGWADPID